MLKKTLLAAGAACLALAARSPDASAKDLTSIGISVGSLGNPYYVALVKGAEAEAKKINPQVQVTTVSSDYDLNKQFNQIDSFIAKGVSMILVTAADQHAIAPAIARAHAAGIVVVGVDVNAEGADAVVQTNNVQAGEIACQFLADTIGHKGDVIIENADQVSAVIDRVNGCHSVLSHYPDIKILSDNENAKGSRDGGFAIAQGYFVRYPKIDGIFTANDPEAIGTQLAAKQAGRDKGLVITSVDGAPDIVAELKTQSAIQASASQDPFTMGEIGVKTGYDIMNGKPPAQRTTLMAPKLITRDNVASYIGWTQH
ncbi:ABC transporter substrate-binding protein [Acidisoma sp. 7E03]